MFFWRGPCQIRRTGRRGGTRLGDVRHYLSHLYEYWMYWSGRRRERVLIRFLILLCCCSTTLPGSTSPRFRAHRAHHAGDWAALSSGRRTTVQIHHRIFFRIQFSRFFSRICHARLWQVRWICIVFLFPFSHSPHDDDNPKP